MTESVLVNPAERTGFDPSAFLHSLMSKSSVRDTKGVPLDLLADVVEHIGHDQLWQALAHWIQHQTGDRTPTVYLFDGKARPEILFQDLPSAFAEGWVNRYLEGAYLLDPFHGACLDHISSGVYTLKDVAPDHFHRTRYCREFYRHCQFLDEICFLSRIEYRSAYIVVSVTRSLDEKPFTRSEFAAYKQADRFVQSTLSKHWALASVLDTEKSHVHRAIEQFGYPHLTEREREVATLILRGHSSKAVGTQLNISVETVRNHRKKVYSKLGIASQSQLFSKFINQVLQEP